MQASASLKAARVIADAAPKKKLAVGAAE